jgi:acyl carrier protein
MDANQALTLIKTAAEKVKSGSSAGLSADSDLLKNEKFDSLSVVEFLFELEARLAHKVTEIDDDFEDYRVSQLIAILQNYNLPS